MVPSMPMSRPPAPARLPRLTPSRWSTLRRRLEDARRGEPFKLFLPESWALISRTDDVDPARRFPAEVHRGIEPLPPGWTVEGTLAALQGSPYTVSASVRITPFLQGGDWIIVNRGSGDPEPVLFVRGSARWVGAVAWANVAYRVEGAPDSLWEPAPDCLLAVDGVRGLMVGGVQSGQAEVLVTGAEGAELIRLNPSGLGYFMQCMAKQASPVALARMMMGTVPQASSKIGEA